MNEAESAFHTFSDSRKAVALVNREGTIISFNPILIQLVDKPAEAIFGKQCKDLLNCEYSATHHCLLNNISHTRQKEHTFCRLDDQWVETTFDPLPDDQGEPNGGVLTMTVVNDPSEAQQKLLKSQRYESIAQTAMGVAHDLNNVFSILEAHTALIKPLLKDDPKAIEMHDSMKTALGRGAELSRQLLYAGQPTKMSNEPIKLNECIKASAEFSLIGSRSQLKLSIADDLWPITTNQDLIKQLVCNLTINARHAITRGDGVIEVEADNIGPRKAEGLNLKPASYIRLRITDNGHGMTDETINQIFNPYFTTKEDGTGLGLATVHYIVKKHNGYMNVKSTLGESTTFSVYLHAGN